MVELELVAAATDDQQETTSLDEQPQQPILELDVDNFTGQARSVCFAVVPGGRHLP